MGKHELYRLLAQKEKEFEKAKLKRVIITILAFSAVFFLVIYFADHPTGFEIIGAVLAAIFIAGLYFFVNAITFSILFKKSEEENKFLESLKQQISELE